jgi:hypothetical protein
MKIGGPKLPSERANSEAAVKEEATNYNYNKSDKRSSK